MKKNVCNISIYMSIQKKILYRLNLKSSKYGYQNIFLNTYNFYF